VPRPEHKPVTFEIDGREVTAPEGQMLVDAAKHGDVEIPYFCYEPKLGQPVGACRMCLVEIEGIPKLQTACSTPVKDGMVVSTTSDRVKHAQNAVVEFLLVNHPLDCPVCDKGGECPLQDISYGWGAGRSRVVEPKRHFKKPLELSPLVAIDRERCILCYRCVRFSQEVAEDHQLVFLERGDHTFVGTHHGHPYVAPFSGNIVELCPVGALTSTAYRFRARPWEIEGAGSICTLCPAQCNVEFTVRDDANVLRVISGGIRMNEDVDDGWLCDKGRYGYQVVNSGDRVTQPIVREGGALLERSWELALERVADSLKKAGTRTALIAGGETTNEEAFLARKLLRDVLSSADMDARTGGSLDAEQARVLARPDLAASVPDVEWAGAVLVVETELVDEMPILELRVRKGRRRNGVQVAVATSHPSALDRDAAATVRFAPGAGEAFLTALAIALGSSRVPSPTTAERAVDGASDIRELAATLRDAGPVVIVWGERLSHGERGKQAVDALLAVASALNLASTDGAGLIEVPAGTNARGMREVGLAPNLGPGLVDAQEEGRDAAGIADALASGEASAVVLLHADPLASHPRRARWEAGLDRATFVVAFAEFVDGAIAEHADVILPAESYAEREGTVVHPDGRIQRLRQAIGHPGDVRPVWWALEQILERLGSGTGALTAAMVSEQVFNAVPFYEGLTLEEVGPRGIRWQERDAASKLQAPGLPDGFLEDPPALDDSAGLRLGTRPSLWTGAVTKHAPVLNFLEPKQTAELSPADAERLGLLAGTAVQVGVNGTRVAATVALRAGMPEGTVYLIEGTDEGPAGALLDGRPQTVEVSAG
jgi:NADH-quinone oxidoreductase subunit G